jgi:hypothetical protein
MTHTRKSSAQGEQTAIGGFQKQYEYAACEIYRHMQDGTLRGITLSEPKAGIFDDLILHVRNEVNAIQIKTEHAVQSVALYTQLKPLIKDIVDSWQAIRHLFPQSRTKLKYIFGGYFSTGDKALANRNSTGAQHSAEFARFLLRNDLTFETIQSSLWSKSLNEFQVLSGLDDDSFYAFLNDIELFDYTERTRNRIENFPPSERGKIEAIKNLLPKLIACRKDSQYLSEADILRELGWKKFHHKHTHEFPVPDDIQDNSETGGRLLQALKTHSSGYIPPTN